MTERPKLIHEFRSYMDYWLNDMFKPDQQGLYPEMSNDNVPNEKGILGSMYLSRILFGACQADRYFATDRYRSLADTALDKLLEFKNPAGGYYWARTYNMEWVHDADNVNMAQAFVLYGLASYVQLYASEKAAYLYSEQLDFILQDLKDGTSASFLDGFDENWMPREVMTRSFGTHFHIMEALVMGYRYRPDERVRKAIEELLFLITDRFIDKKKPICLHRFSSDWKVLPNENWAGHNAECSWVMVHAAREIDHIELVEKTEYLSVRMMENVINEASDPANGGYFNLVPEDGNFENSKSWWPQAEIVLGLLNAFRITGNAKYQQLAKVQIEFISKYFVESSGEWYSEIDHQGRPLSGSPKIFFWKSLYHTVRYYNFLLTQT